jgi:hypothetical protein
MAIIVCLNSSSYKEAAVFAIILIDIDTTLSYAVMSRKIIIAIFRSLVKPSPHLLNIAKGSYGFAIGRGITGIARASEGGSSLSDASIIPSLHPPSHPFTPHKARKLLQRNEANCISDDN